MKQHHSLLLFLIVLSTPAYALAEIPRACSTPATSVFPFCNTSLPINTRVLDLISRINDTEKPPLLTARMSPLGNISSLGLPEYDWGANCVHGVQSRCGTRCPTSFPNPNALGATFNMSLVKEMGAIIGLELRSLWLQGVGENHANDLPHLGLDCWSPNININRDPRWGRNMEVPGEDPYLSGQFGVAYTTGLQDGTLDPRYLQAVVTIKHWDAYSLEDSDGYTRHDFDANISSYDFANTYFPAFKASVMEGNAKGIMCAYNSVNGVPSCASQFLNNTIRGLWGFDGYITSDTGAVYDIYAAHHYVKTSTEAAAAAIEGGTDINSGSVYLDSLLDAVQAKLIDIAAVNLALFRTLKLRFELGLFDPIENQPYWHVSPDVVNTPESQAFNLLATQESLVLLKNEGKTLPLPRGKKIAVIGPHSNATGAMVGNYAGQICSDNSESCVVSPFLAIQAANHNGKTTLAEGCAVNSTVTSGFEAAISAAKDADYVILMIGLNTQVEGEGHDRIVLTLPGVQEEFSQEILALGKPVIIVLLNGGMVAIENLTDGAQSIIEAFYPGYQGGNALASVIFGDYNPGGKLPITIYPADYINEVKMSNMDMSLSPGRTYKYYKGKTTFPFGFGLSYTQFTLNWSGDGKHEQVISNIDEKASYSVNVTNTGDVAGDEVVLAYFVPTNDPLIIKQLYGFQRVHLNPGESVTINFQTTRKNLQVGDEKGNMVSQVGPHTILFTNGVEQHLETILHVQGEDLILEKFSL